MNSQLTLKQPVFVSCSDRHHNLNLGFHLHFFIDLVVDSFDATLIFNLDFFFLTSGLNLLTIVAVFHNFHSSAGDFHAVVDHPCWVNIQQRKHCYSLVPCIPSWCSLAARNVVFLPHSHSVPTFSRLLCYSSSFFFLHQEQYWYVIVLPTQGAHGLDYRPQWANPPSTVTCTMKSSIQVVEQKRERIDFLW